MKFWAAGTLALTVAVAGFSEQREWVSMQSRTSDLVAKYGVLTDDISEACSLDQYALTGIEMMEFFEANTPSMTENNFWTIYHSGAEGAARLIRGGYRRMPDAERCATIVLELADLRGELRTQLHKHYEFFGQE